MTQFSIPKQTDRDIVTALGRVVAAMKDKGLNLNLSLSRISGDAEMQITTHPPESAPELAGILEKGSFISPRFYLRDSQLGNRIIADVVRQSQGASDELRISHDEWWNHYPDASKRVEVVVELTACLRQELRANLINSDPSQGGTEYGRYVAEQRALLSSLQATTQQLLIDATKRSQEQDKARHDKYEQLETALREEIAKERESARAEAEKAKQALEERDAALVKRIEQFNTKESRYVARQQSNQLATDLKEDLKKWTLTEATTSKRWPIAAAYVGGMVVALSFAVTFTVLNYKLLTETTAQVNWVQWVVIGLKSVLPFGVFTTLLVYFIRWQSAWAKAHADEEFRNRARVVDIGRSAWLFEAVRDAQDHKQTLPPELLTQLSKNLFTYDATGTDTDTHPQTASDILLQGLSSLRVKTPDGSEVEAKRDKA